LPESVKDLKLLPGRDSIVRRTENSNHLADYEALLTMIYGGASYMFGSDHLLQESGLDKGVSGTGDGIEPTSEA
jgi:hypothetical protein